MFSKLMKADAALSYTKKPFRESVTKLKPDKISQITALKIFESMSLYVEDDRSKGNLKKLVFRTNNNINSHINVLLCKPSQDHRIITMICYMR